jgi:hypothetical protein
MTTANIVIDFTLNLWLLDDLAREAKMAINRELINPGGRRSC